MPTLRKLLIVCLLSAVASCGGGGSASDGGDKQDSTDDVPTVTVANRFFTTISTDTNIITQNGIESAVITVQVVDDNQNNILVGGDEVVLTTTFGTLSAVTDNNDGTYSATLTISNALDLSVNESVQGLSIITGVINGGIIADHAGVANRIDNSDLNLEFIALSSLGKSLFENTELSNPVGQSCASCHSSALIDGFADPDKTDATSEGANSMIMAMVFGQRNAQTASYAAFIPQSQVIADGRNVLIGGQFWDGRSATLEDQARQPFLNPLEMNNADEASVIAKIDAIPALKAEFEVVFGVGALAAISTAYDQMAQAIAAFQRSSDFTKFNSRFDDVKAGTATFTMQETRGEQVFHNQASCDRCHFTPEDRGEQVFSNFEYFNIGVPGNVNNPFLLTDPTFIDMGLGDITGRATDNGKFRVPSLRNIANTAPYMHNGVFTTLKQVIDFYNGEFMSSDPEVNANLDSGGRYVIGGMSGQDKADLKAFLETFSDM